ncbi:MAG: DegT/DnrJ/EryC1/StrS family aminotransferase [Lachnospiraceae bacterium]|nr:DegT/DnrJ/EryC1/StrS family aminotransferase [Lachnospiraceae bacterium]
MDRIMTNRLDRGFYQYQEEFEAAALRVLRSGWYILGKELEAFEAAFAEYTGARYAVGVGNGLDALALACRAVGIGPGDEVIVQGNTFIASVMGITIAGGTPVFVEPDAYFQIDTERIEQAITPKTKAVMVVHLYGQAARMEEVRAICDRHGLKLIEDCAQSHGSHRRGKMTGTFGDIGCFSFYPSKNLGAFGDGGAVVTDSEVYRDRIRQLRNYGSSVRYYNKEVGVNSRLDEMQAALLSVRLSHMEELTRERKYLAEVYDAQITNPLIMKPAVREGSEHVYHQYVIRCDSRDALITYLKEKGIDTIIHYPVPPHLSEAYAYLGVKEGSLPLTEEYAKTVLSIPIYNGMTKEEQARVIDALNAYRA